VHDFVGWHLGALQMCRFLPQKDARLAITREHFEAHIVPMRDHIADKFGQLVFNLDEVDSSD
jgi:hypothetical protein